MKFVILLALFLLSSFLNFHSPSVIYFIFKTLIYFLLFSFFYYLILYILNSKISFFLKFSAILLILLFILALNLYFFIMGVNTNNKRETVQNIITKECYDKSYYNNLPWFEKVGCE